MPGTPMGQVVRSSTAVAIPRASKRRRKRARLVADDPTPGSRSRPRRGSFGDGQVQVVAVRRHQVERRPAPPTSMPDTGSTQTPSMCGGSAPFGNRLRARRSTARHGSSASNRTMARPTCPAPLQLQREARCRRRPGLGIGRRQRLQPQRDGTATALAQRRPGGKCCSRGSSAPANRRRAASMAFSSGCPADGCRPRRAPTPMRVPASRGTEPLPAAPTPPPRAGLRRPRPAPVRAGPERHAAVAAANPACTPCTARRMASGVAGASSGGCAVAAAADTASRS